MRAVIAHAALAVCLAFVSFACEERPARPSPPSVSGTPVSLEIRGSTRFYRVGDTGQLTAVAVYPNGMKTDAASLRPTFWAPDSSTVVSVTSGGYVKTTGYGRVTVWAYCQQLYAETQIAVFPEGMFLLSGRVVQGTLQLPVPKATVQVLLPGESFSTLTDYSGRYSLPAMGTATLRVEATNFASQSFPVTVIGDMQVDVVLSRDNDAFDGTYRLTFTASPSCSFPANIATRQYIASVRTIGNDVAVDLSGASFVVFWADPGFTGTRDGKDVRFVISDDVEGDYALVEDLGSGQSLSFVGTANGTIDAGQLTTMFSGTVTFRASSSSTPCSATNHRLDFRR